ncbi:MAG: hypothetical protein JOZ41_05410 [Chloroflexi bacterium]|nr:hypothetical protein [Chloroflexota bacterium]
MNSQGEREDQLSLARRRDRTHAIVEGALLSDIAIVFLLMRVYLPVPVVRTLMRAIATVPFVMLTQRRGVRLTVLAAIAGYVLFSALVGPILALTAIDVAVAGILVGIGRRVGLSGGLNTLWTGPVYAVLDLILPTVASVYIFRLPVNDLVEAARRFVRLIFNALIWTLDQLHAPVSVVHQVRGWEGPAVAHWQLIWIGTMAVYGLLTMYLVVLVSAMVLNKIPEQTLSRQVAA